MDAETTTNPNDIPGTADVAFLAAVSLAGAGRLEDAQSILCADGQLPSSPQGLDLLARIALQAGDVEEARKYWQAALQTNPAYQPARKAVDSLSSPWFALAAAKRFTVLAMGSITVGLAAVGLLALFRPLPQATEQPQSVVRSRPPPLTPRPLPAEPPKLHDSVAAISANNAAEAVNRLAQSFELRVAQLDKQIQTLQQTQAIFLAGQEKLAQLTTALTASNHILLSQQQASLDLAENTRRELVALSDQYTRDRQPKTNSAPPSATVPPLNLSIDGITLEPVHGTWNLQFNSALFDRDDHLKIGSKLLSNLMMKLWLDLMFISILTMKLMLLNLRKAKDPKNLLKVKLDLKLDLTILIEALIKSEANKMSMIQWKNNCQMPSNPVMAINKATSLLCALNKLNLIL